MQFLVASLLVMASFSAGAIEVKKITHSTCDIRVWGELNDQKYILEEKGYNPINPLSKPTAPSIGLEMYQEKPKARFLEQDDKQNPYKAKDPFEKKILYTMELIDGKTMIGFQQGCEESENMHTCTSVPRKLVARLPKCVKK